MALLVGLGACMTRPSQPVEPTETELLLRLTSQVITAGSPAERRSLSQAQRARFEADPSYDNMLRLAVVRAFSAALPAELKEVQADLQALAEGREELSEAQRELALMVLTMVDERLRMGSQIASLQSQIDSLTEIEASLNSQAGNGPSRNAP